MYRNAKLRTFSGKFLNFGKSAGVKDVTNIMSAKFSLNWNQFIPTARALVALPSLKVHLLPLKGGRGGPCQLQIQNPESRTSSLESRIPNLDSLLKLESRISNSECGIPNPEPRISNL